MASVPRRNAFRSHFAHACALLLLSALTVFLTSCGNFFSCEGKSDCPCVAGSTSSTTSTPTSTVTTTTTTTCTSTTSTSTTSSSTDFGYISNDITSANNLDGYAISSGALTAISGSPFSFGYSPSALAINPSNTLLYAATDSVLSAGYIYGYSIQSGGTLSILDSGTPLVSESVSSLAISPDGNWLFCLDADGTTLEEYSINISSGALTFINTYTVSGAPNGIVTPTQVTVAPSGDFVVAALGTGGVDTFTFDTQTGIATPSTLIQPVTSASGIFAVAVDQNNNIYCAGTAGLQVFSTTPEGVPTLANTYSTGNGAHSVAINPDYTYIYVGNQTDGTISAFTIGTNAALTAVTGSPFAAPPTVSALAVDNTGGYLVAAGYSATNGVQLYTIESGGLLTPAVSEGTGTLTDIPVTLALSQ